VSRLLKDRAFAATPLQGHVQLPTVNLIAPPEDQQCPSWVDLLDPQADRLCSPGNTKYISKPKHTFSSSVKGKGQLKTQISNIVVDDISWSTTEPFSQTSGCEQSQIGGNYQLSPSSLYNQSILKEPKKENLLKAKMRNDEQIRYKAFCDSVIYIDEL